MKTVYNIDLSLTGINELETGLKERQQWLKQKTDELCERLADMGAVNASLEFSRAIYTGIEDHDIVVEATEGGYKVKAVGETVLFVEFGTGLGGFGHPEPNGYGGGTYPGVGHWDDPNGWWIPREKNGGHSMHTYGNPPNMPMYNTVKGLELELERVVKEVFST